MRFPAASAYVLLGLSAVASCYPAGTNSLPMGTTQSSTSISPRTGHGTPPESAYANAAALLVQENRISLSTAIHLKTVVVTFEHPQLGGDDYDHYDARLYAKTNTLLLINEAETTLGIAKPYNVQFSKPSPCSKERARRSGFKMTIGIDESKFEGRIAGARGNVWRRIGSVTRDGDEIPSWHGSLVSMGNLPVEIYTLAE
ncbi:hypothetical protein F5051DRAFT_506918 [Lentinula edodes]|nr:hypothetical protein F5051DRAFT_506918 [Lentinula edodes]